MTEATVLDVHDLGVATNGGLPIVQHVDLRLAPGEILGLAGESGCGKSTLARALLGYARPGARINGGSVRIEGIEVLAPGGRAVRGRLIAYVAQDAAKALNPSIRVGHLVAELREVHGLSGGRGDVAAVLERVNLPTTSEFAHRFVHQLSGGQQQRLAIGMAVACDPQVIVLDEPTSGLDVVTQTRILDEVRRLCRDEARAAIVVSHDLAALASISHRIVVMYAGRIIEDGSAADVLVGPRHPYTAGLVASVPTHDPPRHVVGIAGIVPGLDEQPRGCAFEPRCGLRTAECGQDVPRLVDVGRDHAVRCIHPARVTPVELVPRPPEVPSSAATRLLEVEHLVAQHGRAGVAVIAADDVSFAIRAGECVALVGESGSGKSTIARCIVGLHRPRSGTIRFAGADLPAMARDRSVLARRRIQIVFQNPYDSLNPSRSVEHAITRPLRLFRGLGTSAARAEVGGLLDLVRLPRRLGRALPHELSGGERQRVAIARALAAGPDLVVCDEITSSLDVSVQAAILDVLVELDVAMLFITHDLGVVASVADTMVVLERGVVRETGAVAATLRAPADNYTRALIDAVPIMPTSAATSS